VQNGIEQKNSICYFKSQWWNPSNSCLFRS